MEDLLLIVIVKVVLWNKKTCTAVVQGNIRVGCVGYYCSS